MELVNYMVVLGLVVIVKLVESMQGENCTSDSDWREETSDLPHINVKQGESLIKGFPAVSDF